MTPDTISDEAEREYQMLLRTWGCRVTPTPRPTVTRYERRRPCHDWELLVLVLVVVAVIVCGRSMLWAFGL